MFDEIFYWLFNMSIASTLMGVIVMLIREIKRIPRRVVVVLWIAPVVRMMIPFGLNYQYSLLSFLSGIITKSVTICQLENDITFSLTNYIKGANRYFPVTYKSNMLEDIFHISAVVWFVVALAIAMIFGILYFVTIREMKDVVHSQGNVGYSDKITSPAVYGIIKPQIVLPFFYQYMDCRFVFVHENAHIQRGDNLCRVIGVSVSVIHWFNPFVWVFLRLFLSDLELACDEWVCQKLSDSQMKEYAHSLLNSKEITNIFVSSFGGSPLRKRIENILSFRKMTRISFVCFAVFIIAIFSVLLTNAG